MMPVWSRISCRWPRPLPISADGNLPDQRQHRRVHGIGREQRRRGIEQARSRHDRIGLRLAGRERRAERHIGGALFVAGVDGAQPVGELEQRVEQKVVLHARQRIDRIEAVGDQRGDDGFGRRHRLCRLRGLGLALHATSPRRDLCRSAHICRGGSSRRGPPSAAAAAARLDKSARRMWLCAKFPDHWRN